MATVRQLITEIRLHPRMNDTQKAYVEALLIWAEARVKLAQIEKQRGKPRRVSTKSNLMTLQAWEEQYGMLCLDHMAKWVLTRNLDPQLVGMLISEFRTEMRSKSKEYADFACAFQNYLNRGYLSKTLAACTRKQNTHIDSRGVTL